MSNKAKLLWLIAGAMLFNLVFWQEKMGLNTVLYDVFVLVVLFSWHPDALRLPPARILAVANIICVAMVLVHNSLLSKVAVFVTLFLTAAFSTNVHRSPWFAGGSVFVNTVYFPGSFFSLFYEEGPQKARRGRVGKVIRFALIPLVPALVFTLIYSFSNSVFSAAASRVVTALRTAMDHILDLFSVLRLLFLLLGLYITGALLIGVKNKFVRAEAKHDDQLHRRRKTKRERKSDGWYNFTAGILGRFATGVMGLKNVNKVAILTLFLLNLLLLSINVIDITYIWLDPVAVKNSNLYTLVHEGTDLLILSILLAMLLLLIFFRGNLNFYHGNRWLKFCAYCWIIQNAILVISVFLRDYYYIRFAGLAYKRIGVLFFLALVLFGLFTLFLKIFRKKTAYFVWRMNAWAAILLMVIATTVNWDEFIAAYNFAHQESTPLDVNFMATLRNKALPLLDRHIDDLKKHGIVLKDRGFADNACGDCFIATIRSNEESFLREQSRLSWLSWNYADSQVLKYLKK